MKPYPTYKHSGVDWIGEIPEHWQEMKLKYSSMILNGYAFDAKGYVENGIPIIRIGDVEPNVDLSEAKKVPASLLADLEEFRVRRNDILLALTGATIGKSAVYNSDEIALLNQRVAIVRPLKSMKDVYLKYIVDSELFRRHIDYECFGGAQENIGKPELGNFNFAFPPLPEQHAIARFLDDKTSKIDALIGKKQKLIELLKEQRTAIINQAVTKGLNPNAKMKASGIEWLGEIPEHWQEMKLKYSSMILNGYAFDAKGYVENGIPIIRIGDVEPNVDLSEAKKVPASLLADLEEFRVRRNDILLALTGATIGKSAVYNSDEIALLNQRVAIVRPLKSMKDVYLKYIVDSELFRRHIDYECFGGAQENIGKPEVGNFNFAFPPLPEQQTIAKYLDDKTNEIDLTIQEQNRLITLLQEYRTALISEVVTGKVDVREYAQSKE